MWPHEEREFHYISPSITFRVNKIQKYTYDCSKEHPTACNIFGVKVTRRYKNIGTFAHVLKGYLYFCSQKNHVGIFIQ